MSLQYLRAEMRKNLNKRTFLFVMVIGLFGQGMNALAGRSLPEKEKPVAIVGQYISPYGEVQLLENKSVALVMFDGFVCTKGRLLRDLVVFDSNECEMRIYRDELEHIGGEKLNAI